MPTFIIAERKAIYEKALNSIENNKHEFMCHAIENAAYGEEWVWRETDFKDQFPEFYIQKPDHRKNGMYMWFDIHDKDSRIKILRKAIELCKQS